MPLPDFISYVITTGMGLILSGVGYLIRKISLLSEQINTVSANQQVIKSRQEIHEHMVAERLSMLESDIRELRHHGGVR